MNINITSRNVELDSAAKDYIRKRFGKLDRIYAHVNRYDVVLEEEKSMLKVEAVLHMKHSTIVAKESSPDIYASVDSAVENLGRQMKRIKEKGRGRRRGAMLRSLLRPFDMFREADVVPGEGREGEGAIVRTNDFYDKPMRPEDAKLEIERSGKRFVVFKNADTGEVNVIYGLENGDYGLIEPKF